MELSRADALGRERSNRSLVKPTIISTTLFYPATARAHSSREGRGSYSPIRILVHKMTSKLPIIQCGNNTRRRSCRIRQILSQRAKTFADEAIDGTYNVYVMHVRHVSEYFATTMRNSRKFLCSSLSRFALSL